MECVALKEIWSYKDKGRISGDNLVFKEILDHKMVAESWVKSSLELSRAGKLQWNVATVAEKKATITHG